MDLISPLTEVDPITGTEIEPQFRNSFSCRPDVTKQSILEPINAYADSRPGHRVETIKPIGKWLFPGIVLADEYFPWNGFQLVFTGHL